MGLSWSQPRCGEYFFDTWLSRMVAQNNDLSHECVDEYGLNHGLLVSNQFIASSLVLYELKPSQL